MATLQLISENSLHFNLLISVFSVAARPVSIPHSIQFLSCSLKQEVFRLCVWKPLNLQALSVTRNTCTCNRETPLTAALSGARPGLYFPSIVSSVPELGPSPELPTFPNSLLLHMPCR